MKLFAYLRAVVLFPLNLEKVMATQAQLAVTLNAATELLGKIKSETQGLVDKVAELTQAVADAQVVSPEVQTALANLQSAIASVDALVPDAVVPEEPETPEEPLPEDEEDGEDEGEPNPTP